MLTLACAKRLLAASDCIYAAFATHNANSIGAIKAMAGKTPFEFQRLHGMGEGLYEELAKLEAGIGDPQTPVRIYAPVGSHKELLAYLVRRLLENGANSSFVNRIADDEVPIEALVRDPVAELEALSPKRNLAIPLPNAIFGAGRRNSAGVDLSDPLVREPLAFRVAHVPHDDGSRLVYRELEGCARALLEALAAGESADMFFHDTDGDYAADAPRTPTDQQAARSLLATDGEHEEWNYATQLLDESNLEGWSRLLETDHFVRRDVVARMRKLHSPVIRELLARDQRAFDEFARRVADAARNDGLKVGEQRNGVLRVNGSWMNLDGFFYRRSIPDAMPRMMAWFHDLVAKRDPRERPDNFMKD